MGPYNPQNPVRPSAVRPSVHFFSGFAIDRSKEYIKIIENDMKIDAVDPQAAADNPPPPPGNDGSVPGPLQPPKNPKTPSNSAVT